ALGRIAPSTPATRIQIEGQAAGEAFGSAVLEAGRGELPSEWQRIATLASPVEQGILGQWETRALPADRYTIRVTVYSKAGLLRQARQVVDLRDWRPDLVVRQALRQLEGGKLTIAVELANQGKQPAAGPIGMSVMGQRGTSPPIRLARWELGGELPAGAQASKTGAVALPSTVSPGRYALSVVLDEEEKIADGDRANNRAIIEPPIDLGPDPVMTQLKAELDADGRSIRVTDLAVNQGLLPMPALAPVRYYLSEDGVIQSTDPVIGQRSLPALAAGERSTATTELSLPAGLTAGSYYVLGRVGLNDYWGSSLTLGPDLTMSALSARIDPERRQLVAAETVKNVGAYPSAGTVPVQYRLLAEGALPQAALALGQSELAGGLAPGEERTAERTFAAPDGMTAGRYRLIGQIDPQQRAADSRRENNQAQSDWLAVGYDLQLVELGAEPSPDGLEVRVTDAVVNRGLLPAAGRVAIEYVLKQDDAKAAAMTLGRRVIETGLAPGERSGGGATMRLPEGSAHYRWKISAQVSAAGVDSQPGNNAQATPFVNEGVDLAVGKAKASVSAAGDRLTVTETVNNYGWAPLNRPVRIMYALSASGLLDGNELPLGDRTISTLPAGRDATTTNTFPLPASLASNRYFLVIQVDPDRRVAEAKRDNNVAAGSTVAIGPQPVLEGVQAQVKPDGGAMAVTVTVANRGNRTMSGPLPVTFGVARDEAGNERVAELGRNTITPLSPGGRATPAFTLSLPPTLAPGAYFVTAQLDGEQKAVSAAALAVGPDLVSQALRAELIGQGEQTKVGITDAIANQGNRPVGRPFTVSYLLSTDWRLDRQDILLGRRTIEQLPAGEQHNATVQFAVPVLTIETGRYFVLSRIDLEGAIEESNPANNLRPTVEGLLIERLEKGKKPDMPDVISAPPPPQTSAK
ncbi:MAG: CARDB domain-containing protein, partial [Nitrospirota bacterium]